MTGDRRVDLLTELVGVTEAQVVAARSLRVDELVALNARHADVAFELRVAFQDPLPNDADLKAALRGLVERQRLAENRLSKVAGSVLGVIGKVLPSGPAPAYGRRGNRVA